ncbi:MAG: UbiX family flavin prenyltransferase [Acidaminococcaceae bacterium]|nr:UbiX family flavin prenyltransferase [Acidaminococcaceae bacterium]MBQ9635210.1 UbiX family flavin prenyltransferase [Acidaminococcaceae bacterium]
MRIIVGVTGASGVIMGYYLLQALKSCPDCEIHLVASKAALVTWKYETDMPFSALTSLADAVYEEDELTALIASGTFVTDGMIVLPCSMKTLAGIVCGYAENLLLRAADVCLKENRKVVLCPREMPLGRIHLHNMELAAQYGCTVIPPMLTFYNGAQTVEDQIHHVIGKILLQFGLPYARMKPWDAGLVWEKETVANG